MRFETNSRTHGDQKETLGEGQVDRTKLTTKSSGNMVDALDKAIGNIQTKLENDDLKGSIADLVRLLQLRHDLTNARPRHITVRWVDECQKIPVDAK